MTPFVRASVCRIADLSKSHATPLERARWASGDYVLGEVLDTGSPGARIELENGRMIDVGLGDLVAGAFGVRHATLEATGTWSAMGSDHVFEAMTSAGVFGRITSVSPFMQRPLRLGYRGHLMRGGHKLTMGDSVSLPEARPWTVPTILIVGSSMSAGKTATARLVVRRLKRMGKRVIGAKLTGCGRFRDVLSMGDAGADAIFDFVDAGLPSTICPEDHFRDVTGRLLARMQQVPADVAVVEAGASPLEPYNGAAAVDLLDGAVRMTILCASDPYAALGIQVAFSHRPDLVAGVATNTDAGIELVERLTGLRAIRLTDREAGHALDGLLAEALIG